MTTTLRVSEDFCLPAEAVTQTFAILAKRGAGKTYTAAVLVEEMIKAGLPVVVIDPVGVWWGLRASADGRREGLAITLIGGDRGDLPLDATAGAPIADLVADESISVVLDLSALRKGEQTRFMTDFAERLYNRNRRPLHVVLKEADAFAPQRPMRGQERLLGAIEDLVRRGRARGLGVTLVTQRAAVLNKDVLTQAEVLVTLRTIAPQDREAIDAWIKVHGIPEERDELMRSLPSLPIGTAWFWSPGWLDVFQKVRIRRRETFDSSATPKLGQKLKSPQALAAVDLEVLRKRLRATVERAQADDPRELRKRIVELETALRARPAVEPRVERIEVAILEETQLHRLQDSVRTLADTGSQLTDLAQDLKTALSQVESAHHAQRAVARSTVTTPTSQSSFSLSAETTEDEDGTLTRSQRRILEALAQFEAFGLSEVPVKHAAALSGASPRSSAFDANRAELRRAGLIEYGDTLRLTHAGLSRVGDVPHAATPGELLEQYKRVALSVYQGRLLDVLVAAFPDDLSREHLAHRAGVSVRSSAFDAALADMRALGLVDYLPKRRLRAGSRLLLERTGSTSGSGHIGNAGT
jgi:uncharacterized protein